MQIGLEIDNTGICTLKNNPFSSRLMLSINKVAPSYQINEVGDLDSRIYPIIGYQQLQLK